MKPSTYEVLDLLCKLIATPSFSREESETSKILENWFREHQMPHERIKNNVYCKNHFFNPQKPTVLLNSHHDTVKPNKAYTRNPFIPQVVDGRLFGLGSNDAGGCLVSLLYAFKHFYKDETLPFNLIVVASAEEEVSGLDGLECVLKDIPPIGYGIIGEPTLMEMAIAEKGLMVLDCTASGVPGHAARNTGKNAIYAAIEAINWFRSYHFEKVSETLGPIKMSVTVINGGSQHNIVPDECKFEVDVRSTDAYSNTEILDIIRSHVKIEVSPRSTRLKPSGLPKGHVLIKAAEKLGIRTFGSPTTSDQAVTNFATVKMGPGDSDRSHSADEYIFVHEIETGIDGYIKLINTLRELTL